MMTRPATARARGLRRNATANERGLWKLLRDRRLSGMKFRRQVALGPYVADFVCFSPRLVVEADGPFHDERHDQTRDAWLHSQKFRVLRFANSQIALYPDVVLDRICEAAGRTR